MGDQKGKIALLIGVVVVALAALAFGMKHVSAQEEYTPSPHMGAGNAGGHSPQGSPSAPVEPGTAPPGSTPGQPLASPK